MATKKNDVPAAATMPTQLKAGDPRAAQVRVVDAATGDEIIQVLEADTEAGTLTRYAVEDGNLVRDGDSLKRITETRAIRFEPIAPEPADEPADGPAVQGDGGDQDPA